MTGIPRVVSEVLKFMTDARVIPIVYDKHLRQFVSADTKNALTLESGSWVLSLGAGWNYPEALELIEELRPQGIRFAQLFHDIIPILFPHFYEPTFDCNFAIWLKKTVTQCDCIFFVSEATRIDFENYCMRFSLSLPLLKVIRLGDSGLCEIAPLNVALPDHFQRFILCVGTLEARKNHQMLFDAIRELSLIRKTNLSFILVGRQGWIPNNLVDQLKSDAVLNERVLHFDSLSDEELAFLYRSCEFTVFPSLYEGWGLPVAESLSFRKPCLTSRSSSLVEIGPTVVWLADPTDIDEWMEKLESLWQNEQIRAELTEKIKTCFVRTSWISTAQEIYNTLLSHKG